MIGDDMSRPRRRKPSKRPPSPAGERAGDRLQKVLAAAGLGSRRECEELIVTGRVEVNGQTVDELGTRVDPLNQEIRVDGVALPRTRRVHFMLNKPPGVVCTNDDPSGRVRAIDLVRSGERLFTVGRLDRTSEGLILVTNDGELANRLTHPRYGVEKRYLARIVGSPNPVIFEKLRKGIHLAEGVARVSDIRVRKRTSKFTDVEIVLQEGRNREIRRILARVGHKVVRLKRIAIGPLRLGELPVGDSRPLTREEVRRLHDSATKARGKAKSSRRKTTSEKTSEPSPSRSKPRSDQRPRKGPPQPHQTRSFSAPQIEVPDVDEVEVTESPLQTSPGAIIGGDADWDGPPPSTTDGTFRQPNPPVP
jgi:23S rRNA pseudouridine2605 synthase